MTNHDSQPTPAALLKDATALGLLDVDDRVRNWFDRLGRARDGAIKDYYTKQIAQRLQKEQNARLGNPFLTAPSIVSEGTILLGHQADQTPVRVSLDGEMNRHTVISGASGSGKSNLAAAVVLQILANTRHAWIFNPKGDTDAITVNHHDTLRFHPGIQWNPMLPITGMSMSEHRYLFSKTQASTSWGGEQNKILCAEAHRLACTTNQTPSMHDYLIALTSMQRKSDPFDRRQTIMSLISKAERYRDLYTNSYFCRQGIPTSTFLQHSLDLPLAMVSEPDQLIATLLISQLYHARRTAGERDGRTSHCILIEEGLNLLAQTANRIDPNPPLAAVWMMAREFGIAFVLVALSPSMISSTITSSAYAQIALPMTDAADTILIARTFGLNAAQIEHMNRKLTTGQAVMRFGGRYRHPILLTIPYLPINKTVTTEQLREVIQRTDAYNPHATPIAEVRTALPSPESKTTTSEEIALNKTELAIATHLANVVIDTVTNCYAATNTHYALGDAAKSKLIQLGYITATSIIAREGRGGRAIALTLTRLGYERLGITPPKRSRGGGPQAEYLLQSMHRQLSGSIIEMNLDGKGIDLALRVDSVQHANFLMALNDHAHAFNGEEPTIPHNVLVGIEVECSDPSKTIKNNLTKDRDAGLQHLIFAVMPKDVQRVIQHLLTTNEDLKGILVINALRLLDALKSGKQGKDTP